MGAGTAPCHNRAITRAQRPQLIAAGRTNREIADDLVLSERTVARHISNLHSKIGARSKSEATAYAIHHSLT